MSKKDGIRTFVGKAGPSKPTSEQLKQVQRIIDAARAFVSCADEFFPEQPDVVGENLQWLMDACDRFGESDESVASE